MTYIHICSQDVSLGKPELCQSLIIYHLMFHRVFRQTNNNKHVLISDTGETCSLRRLSLTLVTAVSHSHPGLMWLRLNFQNSRPPCYCWCCDPVQQQQQQEREHILNKIKVNYNKKKKKRLFIILSLWAMSKLAQLHQIERDKMQKYMSEMPTCKHHTTHHSSVTGLNLEGNPSNF